MYDTLEAFISIKPPTASQDQLHSVSMDHFHRRDVMPQGTWFGPYVFWVLMMNMQTMFDTFKFVDYVTLCEVVVDPSTSQMQLAVRQRIYWSRQNLLNLNTAKTKEVEPTATNSG